MKQGGRASKHNKKNEKDKNTMTKQNKKIIKTIKTKQAPKGKQAKKEQAPKQAPESFAIALKQSSGDIMQALKQSKQARKEYHKKLFAPDTLKAIESIANRLGQGGKGYDIQASFPCKTDLAKIKTITPFENKSRTQASPRMIASLLIAYLNREDGGFNRIFPNGLFIENGALKDLLTGGFIQSKGGENERQRFTFGKQSDWLFNDKGVLALENTLIEGGLL